MTSRSFFTWLFVGNMILITLILSLGSLFTFHSMQRQTVRESELFHHELLEAQRDYIKRIWEDTAATNPETLVPRIQAFCMAFNNRHNRCRLTVVDSAGHVLGDSEEQPWQMALHNTPDRPEIMAALAGKTGEDIRESSTRRIPYRYLAQPVEHGGIVMGAVRLAMPMADIQQMRTALLRGVVLNSVLTLLIALALSAVFAWYWFRPLRMLHGVAKNISRGDLKTPVVFHGPLELEHLAGALEHMRETVSAQVELMERQRVILQTIFNDLDEAIFAIDREDRLLYVNTSAHRMLEIPPQASHGHLWSVMRHGTILSLYEQMKSTQKTASGQMELEIGTRRMTLEVQASPISPQSSSSEIASLLIVRDRTQWARMNQMKADFVANASHELRTPLTTIRAAIDNLRDGVADDPAMVAHLLNILDRHVSRLEAMVQDLLDLHIVENDHIQNRVSTVRGEEVTAWLTDLFSAKATDKDVKMRIDCEANVFETDEKRLHLILQNIVDNAIKFSEPGHTVWVRMWLGDDALQITCQDNGCGIPPEEQSKIFDRFYQANAAKSGDNRVRGIGLGMAIVKHALERLGGKIELDSRPGVGTTVKIQIPV